MISKTNVKHFFKEFSCLSTTLSQIKHLDHKIFLIPSLQNGPSIRTALYLLDEAIFKQSIRP